MIDGEIRGAWTTEQASVPKSGTPKLAELIWKRPGRIDNAPPKGDLLDRLAMFDLRQLPNTNTFVVYSPDQKVLSEHRFPDHLKVQPVTLGDDPIGVGLSQFGPKASDAVVAFNLSGGPIEQMVAIDTKGRFRTFDLEKPINRKMEFMLNGKSVIYNIVDGVIYAFSGRTGTWDSLKAPTMPDVRWENGTGTPPSMEQGFDSESTDGLLVTLPQGMATFSPDHGRWENSRAELKLGPMLPKFDTPEALMDHFADCQFRGDEISMIACLDEASIHMYALSYLISASQMEQTLIESCDFDKNSEVLSENVRQLKKLQRLLDDAGVDRSVRHGLTVLLAAGEAAGDSSLSIEQLSATHLKLLKRPRAFVIGFLELAWLDDDPDKVTPEVRPSYRISRDGDRTFATDESTGDQVDLVFQNDGWRAVGESLGTPPQDSDVSKSTAIDTAEQKFAALQAEQTEIDAAYSKAAEEAVGERELNRVYEKMDPREIMPAKFLALEETCRGTEVGFRALVEVASMARSVGDPNSNAAEGRVEVIDRLLKHYLKREGLEKIAVTLNSGPFAAGSEEFLQALIDKSPYPKTQAEALLAQVIRGKKILKAERQLPFIRKNMESRLAGSAPAIRADFLERMKKLEATDFKQLRNELNKKLDLLGDKYSDIKVGVYGTGRNAAERLRHAINKVIVGAEAPEVAAVDIDGKPFRLSKLRGKIVVLIFAQSVSDDYAKMYAPVRQLAAKYETTPVRFVGIMSNDDRANLDAAAKRGDLPWTVLPQPLNGPLQLDWGIKGYPSVYIVDEKGILQPELHMPYYGAGGYDTKDVDDKLEELVRRLAVKKQNSLNSGEPGVNKTEPTSGIETAVSSASQKDSPIGVFNRYSRMIEQRNWKEVLACMTEDCRDEEILERLAGIHLLSLYAKPTEEQVKNNTNPTRFRSAGFLKELEQQFPGFTKANANQDSTDRKLQEKLKSLDPAERRQAKLSLVRKNAGVDRDKLFTSLIDFMSRLDGSDLNGQQKSKLVDFDVRGEDASAVIVADDNGERKPVAFKKTTSGWKLDNLNDDSVMDKMAAMHREVEGINRTILDSGLQQMREAGVPEEEIKKFEQEAWQEMKQATEPPSSASD